LIPHDVCADRHRYIASRLPRRETGRVEFQLNQRVRCNLAGLMVKGVLFHAAVTDALGTIMNKTSDDPPTYLVKLLFAFKGLTEIEVPADRIKPI
jgi:hypothetical protein